MRTVCYTVDMLKKFDLSLENPEELLSVARALNSPQRIEILRLLNARSMNIKEMAQMMHEPFSSTALNVDILQKSNLILAETQYNAQGQMKLCSRNCDSIHIEIFHPSVAADGNQIVKTIPIGSYCEYSVKAPCGLVSPTHNIGHDNETDNFFDPTRFEAGLLWFSSGYVCYRISNKNMPKNLKALEISFESCSEAPFYRNDWKSDIFVQVNDVVIDTWLCPGDFGGRRGRLNPSWWSENLTQYGILNTWSITNDGTYLNNRRVNGIKLKNLHLDEYPYIELRIGVKEDAKYCGGINLFGASFGDHEQDVIVRAVW